MKRVIVFLLAVVLLAGAAFTMQTLSTGLRPTNLKPTAAARLPVANSAVPRAQTALDPIPEPVSIILSSLALFGCTTLLRRHRLDRRSDSN